MKLEKRLGSPMSEGTQVCVHFFLLPFLLGAQGAVQG